MLLATLVFFNPISIEDVKWFLDSGTKNQINRVEQVIDANADGIIQSDEIKNAKARALLFDVNKDGALSTAELGDPFKKKDAPFRTSNIPTMLDRDGDLFWSADELDSLSALLLTIDRNSDGNLDSIELAMTLNDIHSNR